MPPRGGGASAETRISDAGYLDREMGRTITSAMTACALVAVALVLAALAPAHAAQTPTYLVLQVPTTADGTVGINMSATLVGIPLNYTGGAITWYLNGSEVSSSAVRDCGRPCLSAVSLFVHQCGCSSQQRIFQPGAYGVTVAYNGTTAYAPSEGHASFTVPAIQATTQTTGSIQITLTGPTTATSPGPALIVVQVQQADPLAVSVAIVTAGALVALAVLIGIRSGRPRGSQQDLPATATPGVLPRSRLLTPSDFPSTSGS